jgi:hypothetical protein
MRPRLTTLLLAVAFLAIGSVVQASIRGHHHPRDLPNARFDIAGRLRGPLWPGRAQPIDISLSNRIRHELWISDLRVTLSVDPAHAAAGCSPGRDFVVAQVPPSMLPIRLPPQGILRSGWPASVRWSTAGRWSLRRLGVPRLPSITMVNLGQIDQDGCKGATLRLGFRATSRMKPLHVWVRTP